MLPIVAWPPVDTRMPLRAVGLLRVPIQHKGLQVIAVFALIPTVSPAKNSLVHFISIIYIGNPVWRGHREEAKRGPPCGPRLTRNEGAMVPLLLPCAPTGWSSIAACAGVVPPLGGSSGPRPARCRTDATGCACGAGRRCVRV